MARKSRYFGYYQGFGRKEVSKKSTKESIHGKLKSLKDEAAILQVPVGVSDAPKQ